MSKKNKRITYESVGDDYETKDPIKKLFQESAKSTRKNLRLHGFSEVSDTRGESAYVWSLGSAFTLTGHRNERDKKQGPFLASVIEGLGTKNLIADGMRKITG